MSGAGGSLVARGLRAEVDDRVLFQGLDLTVAPGDRVGVVGANGSGKSTLLRVLAGDASAAGGSVVRHPPDLTVGVLDQEVERSGSETAGEWIRRRTGVAAADAELASAARALADGKTGAESRYDRALDRWTRLGCADAEERLTAVADELGMPGRTLAAPTATLSGGEAARLGLAAMVLSRFDVALLDEPTNDLDLDGLDRLDRFVTDTVGALVVVSHDRVFLEHHVRTVVDLKVDGVEVFAGGWQAYVDERRRAHQRAADAHARYERDRSRLTAEAQRQREWGNQGIARMRRNADPDKFVRAGQKAGAESRGSAASAAERALNRLDPVDKPWQGWELRFEIATTARAGSRVLWWDDATVHFGDVVVGPFSEEIAWGERVHLAGSNGSGKTTLLHAALGRLPLASGAAGTGPSVISGEIGQRRDALDGEPDALRWMHREAGLDPTAARSLLAKFGVLAHHLDRPIPSWSTGERTRAHLALLQARGVNLVILDEPTNHLDLEAIEQVEAALDAYDGTVVVVSHDRRFVEHLAITRTVEVTDRPG